MTKLIIHSNAPWAPTGYGQQVQLFAPKLAEHYDLAISAFYGLEGRQLVWHGVPVYPGLGGEFGGEYLAQHAKHHFKGNPRDGMVLTLLDVWVLPNSLGGQLNMVCWTPIDHEPIPPQVQSFFGTGAVPLAMSRFGERQMADLDPLYCPHGVDTKVYKPYDRDKVREEAKLPKDAFIVGMVAANKGRPSRKSFSQAFQAFRVFREKHKDAILYLHTFLNPAYAEGENLLGLLKSLEIPDDVVRVADQYRVMFNPYSPEEMAIIYSGIDVLLNPAMGEGFGLPVLEAQSCGIPVVVTNFSAMQEVAADCMPKVACRPYWTGQGSWQAVPDVEEIVEALEHLYSMSAATRTEVSSRARTHAEGYDVDLVFEKHMMPALRAAEERFEDRKPVNLKVAA